MIHASNAKFIEWVKIWLQEQEAQPFVKKHLKQVYQKALAGLEKHDGKLLTGHDAKRVPGIGDFIANKLESKRLEYIKKGGEWEEIPMRTESVPVVKKSASKPYCPRYGSSAYAILIGMSKLRQGTTRSDIILEAQKYTQTSLTESSGSKAGWSSMNKLLSEGLVFVQKQGNLHHYYLTDTGRELADKFRQYENKKSSQETLVDFNDLSLSHPESIPIDTALKRGSFEIVLVLDSREVKNQRQRSYFQTEFEKIGIKTMTKALALGDFVWIARPKDASKKLELVLDVLVERKSGDDLDMSIKDGRYKEQKNRLHNSKMRHIIYLLENMQMDDQSETRLFSAVAKIQLLNGFTVKITQTAAESVQYLARVTKYLESKYLAFGLRLGPRSVCEGTDEGRKV
ncbi:restriction endonuclease type II-like protein [Gorgonomyces haynaldii]|nr:restriction endonuclease type II-like protein [Gorgonomyces haynaldii]